MPCMTRRNVVAGLLTGLASGNTRFAFARAPGPPIWLATRGSARLFFFGQMPVRADSVWLSDAVEEAFDASSELWTENPDPAAGVPAPRPVSTGPMLVEVATEEEMTRLRALLVREGLAADALDKTLLSDAYAAVSWLQDHSIGADFNNIPERVLRTQAKAAGKAVHSEWSSFEEIQRFGSELPADVRQQLDLELFRRGLDEGEQVEAARQRLAEWLAGDMGALDAMARRNRRRYPRMQRLIGADRDKAWVARAAAIMDRTQTAFICAGIGHLLGPTSILANLQNDGLKVRRI